LRAKLGHNIIIASIKTETQLTYNGQCKVNRIRKFLKSTRITFVSLCFVEVHNCTWSNWHCICAETTLSLHLQSLPYF